MKESVFKCKHCQTPLGVAVGARLIAGTLKLGRHGKTVTVECVVCNRVSHWTPDKSLELVQQARTA